MSKNYKWSGLPGKSIIKYRLHVTSKLHVICIYRHKTCINYIRIYIAQWNKHTRIQHQISVVDEKNRFKGTSRFIWISSSRYSLHGRKINGLCRQVIYIMWRWFECTKSPSIVCTSYHSTTWHRGKTIFLNLNWLFSFWAVQDEIRYAVHKTLIWLNIGNKSLGHFELIPLIVLKTSQIIPWSRLLSIVETCAFGIKSS